MLINSLSPWETWLWFQMLKFKTQVYDVIKWKHFPRYWHFVRWIYRSPVNSPHKGQWRGAFIFSLICAWTNGWANNHRWFETRSRSSWRHCNEFGLSILSKESRNEYQRTSSIEWYVGISLDNGLVPSSTKSLPKPMLINLYIAPSGVTRPQCLWTAPVSVRYSENIVSTIPPPCNETGILGRN